LALNRECPNFRGFDHFYRPISMIRSILSLVVVALTALPANAQQMTSDVVATSPMVRAASAARSAAMDASSVVKNVPFRNIGPTVMSGRVVDIDAWAQDPTHFFVAYASGGLWRTRNNGVSFDPVFDNQDVMTIGDIAVDWSAYPQHEPTVWVGTGENNSSRSSYAGNGVYSSTDGGGTWTHHGLDGTQRTGRILLHPTDPNTVYVGALGPLYHASDDRGFYKTTDGGETWQKTLFVDANTGVIDLVADPGNPDVMYAATWHRERRSWNFVEGGGGSGIYRTDDGGDSWAKITGEGSGFPDGKGVGRIGLAIYNDDPSIMYALLDNYFRRPVDGDEEEGLTRDALRTMSSKDFLALDEADIEMYLDSNNFPREYNLRRVRGMVRDGEIEPVALVEFVEDANSLLFETNVIGAQVYRSNDAGATWTRTHEDYLDGLYSSYGYYFGEIRVAPDTPDRIYIMGVPILKSEDAGASWSNIGGGGVHSDHQAMWVNPNRVGHIINGNDGGLNVSWDDGENWLKLNTPPVGQFYSVQIDAAEPYNVYGGLQDNGVWFGPSSYTANSGWYGRGQYPYRSIAGGDGMQVEVDTRDNTTVYTGSQFGAYSRINTEAGGRLSVRPPNKLGEPRLRFNWQVPIHLSRHNQDILYYGSNQLHRSMQQGADMKAISPDLTKGGRKGDVPFGTLATIDESPLQFGLLYTGSDDGYVHVSRDGGTSWTRISDDLPQDLWVSRVEASNHKVARVFVTLNGYRWDHFDAYVYVSEDFGATWTRIDGGLPGEPVNVIVEDPEVEDLLYVGTDQGLYVSLDGGATWDAFAGGLPGAPVHDLKVHQEAKDLVVGTHGRSVYIGSVAELQELTPEIRESELHLFTLADVSQSANWGRQFSRFSPANEPSTEFGLWAGSGRAGTLRIRSEEGEAVYEDAITLDRGLNYLTYDLSATSPAGLPGEPEEADNGKTYLTTGEYKVEITAGGATSTGALKITEARGGGRRFGDPKPAPGIK
jgi:photosystem II stability/assembly factor-like uncharacterized protein